MMKKRIIISGAVLSAVVLALAACSNNGDGGNAGNGSSGSLADSFFVLVAEMVATSPDDADARETDSVTATSPDDADTTSLGG
jgi:ABC-type oligopeptide transport system substrate-binding subunit